MLHVYFWINRIFYVHSKDFSFPTWGSSSGLIPSRRSELTSLTSSTLNTHIHLLTLTDSSESTKCTTNTWLWMWALVVAQKKKKKMKLLLSARFKLLPVKPNSTLLYVQGNERAAFLSGTHKKEKPVGKWSEGDDQAGNSWWQQPLFLKAWCRHVVGCLSGKRLPRSLENSVTLRGFLFLLFWSSGVVTLQPEWTNVLLATVVITRPDCDLVSVVTPKLKPIVVFGEHFCTFLASHVINELNPSWAVKTIGCVVFKSDIIMKNLFINIQ